MVVSAENFREQRNIRKKTRPVLKPLLKDYFHCFHFIYLLTNTRLKLLHKNEHLRLITTKRELFVLNISRGLQGFLCTSTLILVLFVPIAFVAMQSYKPLSARIKLLMVSVPWFTSVLPPGKGLPTLLQLITGRGNPSA